MVIPVLNKKNKAIKLYVHDVDDLFSCVSVALPRAQRCVWFLAGLHSGASTDAGGGTEEWSSHSHEVRYCASYGR